MDDRTTVIKHDCTSGEWNDFEHHIEMLSTDNAACIADRLGLSQQTCWQDYSKLFAEEEWRRFLEAYQHCTGYRY